MMKPDEMIAVIQAHKDGKKIESRTLGDSARPWNPSLKPTWGFDLYEYRVKPEPKELFAVFSGIGLCGSWMHESSAREYAARCTPSLKAHVVRMQEVL